MKKLLVIGAIAAAIVVTVALGLTGWAYAQDSQPTFGDSWMGMGGRFRGQTGADEYGPMHEYMIKAMAKALGMTAEELEAAHDSGKTMSDIAQEQGLTFEDFQAVMLEARTEAFNQMVLDGVISQEQADWMLNHMNGGMGGGFGRGGSSFGGCEMSDEFQSGSYGPGMHGGRGGRWNNQP